MTIINAVSNIIAFSIAVRWGIVAVAAAYVIRGYLTTPIEFWMLRKIGIIDIKNYFRQLTVPIVGSITIIVVVTGLRFLLSDLINLNFQLVVYIFLGIVAYLVVVKLLKPSLLEQIITILQYILPKKFLRLALKDRIKERIFLVGCPRSGTTLLQSLLAANSKVLSFPETHFFGHLFYSRKLLSILGIANWRARLRWVQFLKEIGHQESMPFLFVNSRKLILMFSIHLH